MLVLLFVVFNLIGMYYTILYPDIMVSPNIVHSQPFSDRRSVGPAVTVNQMSVCLSVRLGCVICSPKIQKNMSGLKSVS